MVIVVDPSASRGAALLSGELEPPEVALLSGASEPVALEHRIRLANALDTAAVAQLRTWAPDW